MNKEIEIIVNGKPIKMNLPPDLQDSKIVIEDDKVFVKKGVVDYINNLKFENKDLQEENQRLNNVLNELEKWIIDEKCNNIAERIVTSNGVSIRADKILDKLKELKESDK